MEGRTALAIGTILEGYATSKSLRGHPQGTNVLKAFDCRLNAGLTDADDAPGASSHQSRSIRWSTTEPC